MAGSLQLSLSAVAAVLQFHLLSIVGVNADAKVSGDGASNCPCLQMEDLPKLAEEDSSAGPNNNGVNLTEYGAGCRKHDSDTERCGNFDSGSWCDSEWCFVDPTNCDVPNIHSFDFPNSMRFLSYNTCGFVNTWTREPNGTMNGKVLQAAVMNNHRGYQGTICKDDGQCYGTVVDLVKYLGSVNDGLNITVNIAYEVPEEIYNRSLLYKPFQDNKEHPNHGACVYATGASAVDLCIGAFTKNRHRTAVSHFVEMGVTSEYLIVNENGSKASTWQMIQRIFEPFSLSLWAVTFAVLIALSLLFALQESAASSLSAFKEKPISFTVNAVYSALLRFWSQETMLPTDGRYGNGAVQTWSGRFTLLAIGVQLLLTGASYTANLTTFLIRTGFTPTVSSMDDAIEQQFKRFVC